MMAPTRYRRSALIATAVVLALTAGIEGTFAQTSPYPSRPVRLIVPFEPGGSTDITARLVAKKLGDLLHATIYVENRSGAGGNIGTDIVAKAQPDGYTLLWANVAPIAINPHLYSKLPFDPTKDFAPITLATVFPNVIVVKPSLAADTLATFRAKANTEFKQLFFASAGNGSSTHLAAEWLNSALGTQWTHVPYKGGGPALMAVVAGQVDLYFSSVPAALPHLQMGTLKAIATTGAVRDSSLPDVPTVAEAGIRDFEVLNWNGLLAPAGTPQDIIDLLNKSAVEALTSPDLLEQLAKHGAQPRPMTTAEFAAYIKKDSARWAEVVKTTKLKIN
jgi:tripartite-type tricarboxylate transporter receptor subunit TctC